MLRTVVLALVSAFAVSSVAEAAPNPVTWIAQCSNGPARNLQFNISVKGPGMIYIGGTSGGTVALAPLQYVSGGTTGSMICGAAVGAPMAGSVPISQICLSAVGFVFLRYTNPTKPNAKAEDITLCSTTVTKS